MKFFFTRNEKFSRGHALRLPAINFISVYQAIMSEFWVVPKVQLQEKAHFQSGTK